jgi:hypothetical protein
MRGDIYSRESPKRHPTEWEDEAKRESDNPPGIDSPGVVMSAAEDLAASQAELPAPDMDAALRDRAIDLAATGRADPPTNNESGPVSER